MRARRTNLHTLAQAAGALALALLVTLSGWLSAAPAAAATTVGAGTVENTSASLLYAGTWGTASSSSDSGGSVSTLAGTGSASLSFKETSVRWTARTGNFYGIAAVYLDDVQVATIDLYSPSSTYKTVVWSATGLSFDVHTVRIERTGTKNDASTGRSINFDSLVVADSRPPATPGGVAVTTSGAGARVSWTPNAEDDLAGYLVQRATANGSFTSVTSSPVTDAGYVDAALTPGTTYRYRVSAVDRSGNESARTAAVQVVGNGTAVGPGLVENSSAAVTYTGSWTVTTATQDSGGSLSTQAATGWAQLAFRGTGITLLSRTGNYFGVANVYLDDELVTTADQYAAATTYRSVVYVSPKLDLGVHTLRVERSGTKNDASSGRSVNVDGFVVVDDSPPATPTDLRATAEGAGARVTWDAGTEDDLAGYLVQRAAGTGSFVTVTDTPLTESSFVDPALTPGTSYRYRVSAVDTSGNESPKTAEVAVTPNDSSVGAGTIENTSADIAWSGTWATSTSNADSGGSVATLASTGYAQLAFRETGVSVVARTGSYYGILNVYLDGSQVAAVDLYAASGTSRTVVWSSPTLAYGAHTVRVERSGNKNDASAGRSVNLDAFVVPDTRAPAMPRDLTATQEGAGARLSWAASTEADLAGYVVQRATGTSSTFTTLNDVPLTDPTYADPALTPGAGYRYRVSAVDTSGNESARTGEVAVTAADTSVGAGTVENTASDITYSGSWASSSSSQDSGGSVATLATTGFAQLSFRETSVQVVARTASYYGIANVYLDDTLVGTLDQYSATTAYKTVAYTSPTLPYGVHTLRVERSGTKNDASSSRTVNIDSFVVLDSRAPATPAGLSATTEGPGARLSWAANTEADLAGYLVYRAVGTSGTYEALTDTPVTQTGFLDPTLDPDTTYRYRVAAVDTSGNASSRTGDVTLASKVSVVGSGPVESTSDTIAYTGPWTTATSSSDSGGSSAQLASTGYAQLAFRETSVRIVARTANYFGVANLYLDGAPAGTLDLYSDASAYKSVVWTSPTLAYGTHTLRIERSGLKNDASAGRSINVDSFVVPDTRAPATPTGLGAAARSTGALLTWDASGEPDLGGYLLSRAPEGSDAFLPVTDPVTGTSYSDLGLAPDTGYRYRISAVDTSGNESAVSSEVLVRTAAGNGTYAGGSVSVTRTGGPWSADVDPVTGRDEGVVATAAGTASLTFLESGVRWVGSTGPDGGVAQVYVDGTLVTSVDQYSASVRRDVVLYEATRLGAGAHTIKVAWTSAADSRVTGTPRTSVKAFVVPDATAPGAPRSVWALPTGNGIDLEWNESPDADTVGYRVYRAKGSDAFTALVSSPQTDTSLLDPDLAPGTTYRYQVTAVDASGNESLRSDTASATTALSTGTVENTSQAITYSTPWTVSSSTRDSGGSYSSLGTTGDARLTFSGTGIKWVTRTNSFSGIGQVYLDGVAVAKVDLYSAVQQYQQVVWSTSTLTDGTHTIRIERTGTLNPSSTGRNLTLDAFVITDSTAPPTVPGPTVTNTRLGTKVSWSASSAKDVAAYNLLRTGPDGVETLLDRLPPDQLSFLDVGLAPATSYGFRVTAVDTSGNESKPATAVTVTTPPRPAPVQQRYGNCPTATRTVSTIGSLQNALRDAQAGDVIVLKPGTYTGSLSTSVVGTEAQPVWICGPRTAVIDFKDPTRGMGFALNGASWVTVTGMTVQNVQKGVVVASGSHVTVSDVHFADIGDEAVHLRAFTVDSTVVGNVIERTGLFEPQFGEGVYIGSDPGAWCTYSGCAPDRSDRNSVLDNTITGTTAEPVDAKAGTSDGTVSGNTVDGSTLTTQQADGLIVVKGTGWLVSGNTGTNAPANGFTATYSKAEGWGGGNVYVANQVAVGNTTGYGVWVQRGIGNLVGCDNTSPGGIRTTNVVCQR